jgi:iron complex outermembrane receptor protein
MAPRRMQVLVDGMSVYRTGKAEMDWTQIPVNIEDIDRIEVIRGPNTSSYGENAAVGVVNIITRHPEDDWGTRIKFHGGSDGVKDTYIRHGGAIGNHSYRLSASQSYDNGFDKNAAGEERRDSSDIKRLNISTFFDITDDDKLEVSAGLVDGENKIEHIDSSQITFPDIDLQNSYFQSKWSHSLSDDNEFYIKAYYMDEEREQEWRSCLPQILVTPELRAMHNANPEYAATILAGEIPNGGTPEDDRLALEVFRRIELLGGVAGASSLACGWTNQNYYLSKKDIELQDTHVFSDKARIIYGLGSMHAKIDSSTYSTSGSRNVRKNRFFSNLEYKFMRFSTNLGFMLEDESMLDERLLSPRMAVHYSIDKNQVLKFVTSRAYRTPDIFELGLDQNYLVTDLTPPVAGETIAYFYYSPSGDFSDLEPEKVVSKELIWYSVFHDIGLTSEIKIYNEKLTNLISEKLQFFDFNPTNNGEADINGIEAEISYHISKKLFTRFAYSYQDVKSNTPLELSFHTNHSGSVLASYILDSGYTISGAYFAHSAIQGFDYHRFDLLLAKEFVLGSNKLRVSLLYQYMPAKQGGAYLGTDFDAGGQRKSIVENDFDYNNHFFVTFDLDL